MATVFARTGLSPFLFFSNILTWISSIIIMGILSHWIAQQPRQPNHLVYEEVTVRFSYAEQGFAPLYSVDSISGS